MIHLLHMRWKTIMINILTVQRSLRTFWVKFTDSPLQEISILSYLVYNKPGFQPSALWLISVIFQEVSKWEFMLTFIHCRKYLGSTLQNIQILHTRAEEGTIRGRKGEKANQTSNRGKQCRNLDFMCFYTMVQPNTHFWFAAQGPFYYSW